jgi:hypothetical protein
MQRYLDRILQTALDANEQLRTLSFKVITQIVQQGQAHPVIVRFRISLKPPSAFN